jgi:hypothetical protein
LELHAQTKQQKETSSISLEPNSCSVMKIAAFALLPSALAYDVPSFLRGHRSLQATTWRAGDTCDLACDTDTAVCSEGFLVTVSRTYNSILTTTSYEYEVCSPPLGQCEGKTTTTCADNLACIQKTVSLGACVGSVCEQKTFGGLNLSCGNNGDCKEENVDYGPCSRACADTVHDDNFSGLSHFDVFYPTPTTGNTCLTNLDAPEIECSQGSSATSDGSCAGITDFSVAKCDGTSLATGECLTMKVTFTGTQLLGQGIVAAKAGADCHQVCMYGPACAEIADCNPDPPTPDGPGDSYCLTHTIGFWGTHPWITDDYATSAKPIEVCGVPLYCDGRSAEEGGGDREFCGYGECHDIMEALGSVPGECTKVANCGNYVGMVRQLTAAKLSLKATEMYVEGMEGSPSACGSSLWTYHDLDDAPQNIAYWIDYCDSNCGNPETYGICTAALDDFNNLVDVLKDDVTPEPFNRPCLRDGDGACVVGADPSSFTAAQGSNLVIGKDIPGQKVKGKMIGGSMCAPPEPHI